MNNQLSKNYPRKFISSNFNPIDIDNLSTIYDQLIKFQINSKNDLENFLDFWSELGSIIDEAGSLSYVKMTSDTKNKEIEEQYLFLVEKVFPLCQEKEDLVIDKFLNSNFIHSLDQKYYGLFIKQTKSQKEIFRKENIELITKDSVLCQNYQKITGSWMIDFDEKKQTVQQMQIYQESLDRNVREKAYLARVQVHLDDADKLNDLYDEMLDVRSNISKNSGFENYRDYKFVEKNRFDYKSDDCLRFHDAIAETIVPLLNDWTKEKCNKLNISSLRPWDLYVDPDSKGLIKAFDTEDEFCKKIQNVFNDINPKVGQYFQFMRDNQLLDLSSREGKAPGGYMTELSEKRVPFIFMNAVGTKRDIDTLLHEGGHAFHAFEAREQVLRSYRSSQLEFAEVASMSMELLGRKYFHYIYSKEDLKRVLKEQLVKIVEFFPFMAMIDSFQHWVYCTKDNDRNARGLKWQELNRKFQPFLDMNGLEMIEKTRWQYPHVYTVPFYYIEYGIAQIGALQVWKNSLDDEKNAVDSYLSALSLGGSKSLPELFNAAKVEFSMDKKKLTELVDLIRKNLEN
jgi:oligoendopeptidase F